MHASCSTRRDARSLGLRRTQLVQNTRAPLLAEVQRQGEGLDAGYPMFAGPTPRSAMLSTDATLLAAYPTR
jgi:hypothetical protein